MKQRYILLLLAALLVQTAAMAGPRSRSQAQAIAEKHAALVGKTITEEQSALVKRVGGTTVNADDATPATGECNAFYVFSYGTDEGYALIAADDRLPDLVGYSLTGNYDEATMPDGLTYYLRAYAELAQGVANGDPIALATAAEATTRRASGVQTEAVSPLLGSIKFGQSKPYNNMCPEYKSGYRSATGCVATAMAQVMTYYKYPKALQATTPEYNTSGNITVPSIPAGETYDWDNILPSYTGDYNDTQAAAVAKLLYHCGAAVKANYGSSTGASVTPGSLSTYFGYDADLIQKLTRADFTLATWTTLINNELQAARPVLYAGQSSNAGHEFVIDGVDETGLYHVNWGWNGWENGYFDITILNPDKGGTGSGDAPDGYNRACTMIIGVQPDNGKTDEPLVNPCPLVVLGYLESAGINWTTTTRTSTSGKFAGEAVYPVATRLRTDYNGTVALGLRRADGTYTILSESKDFRFPAKNDNDCLTYREARFTFDYAFPVGRNEIHVVYYDGDRWLPCSYSDSNPVIIDVTETSFSKVSTPLTGTVAFTTEVFKGQKCPVTITLTNNSSVEYLGFIHLLAGATNEQPTSATEKLFVCVPAGATITRTSSVTPTADDVYVWLTDYVNNNVAIFGPQHYDVTTATAPVLSLVSFTDNATPGDYETENAYYYDYRVKMPRVNDDKAVFTATIRNDGGIYNGTIRFYINKVKSGSSPLARDEADITFAANSTTTISTTVRYADYGCNDIECHVVLLSDDYTLSMSSDNWHLSLVDKGGYFNVSANARVVYMTGVPSGISAIETEVETSQPVYTISGLRIASPTGRLKPGIYIQNGKKFVVKK